VIVVDVNLLLYAVIDGFRLHTQARGWWEDALNADRPVGLTEPALFGFLRLSTNGRVFDPALEVEQAATHIRAWLDRPNVELLEPGRRHMDVALDLLHTVGTAGNLTTDAQLAAYAIEHGAELHSNDADFGRFPGLRWVNPLEAAG
jgi:toxin-antitoxin system PIN domain toxin